MNLRKVLFNLRIIFNAFAFCDVAELLEERSQIVGRDAAVVAEVADVQFRLKKGQNSISIEEQISIPVK